MNNHKQQPPMEQQRDRGKWFTKVGWSYVPDTLPGCLFIGLIAAVGVGLFFLVKHWEGSISNGTLNLIQMGGFVALLVFTLIVGRKRS